ncbi:MAG: FKBP-type peptidyl-prolyl cis-trans isomerase [Bacteroidales bacterium]|nr:FKBP-type peptidyl-prolyl cis-trans isomerase [Bacteroidales bacterium]
MKKLVKISLLSTMAFACVALSSCNAQVPKADLKTDLDSISYAQGVLSASQIDQMFMQLGIEDANRKDYINGFLKGMKADPKNSKEKAAVIGEWMGTQFAALVFPTAGQEIFQDSTLSLSKENFSAGYIAMIEDPESAIMKVDEARPYMMTTVEKVRGEAFEKKNAKAKEENEAFLEKNKSEEGVVVLPSGLQYKVVKEGNGPKPVATDKVKVDYHGTNIYGEVFDSSIEAGEPITFELNRVIKGWTEGLQLMPVGSKYILYVPYDLAYGREAHSEKIGPYATLIFEVDLHEIVK